MLAPADTPVSGYHVWQVPGSPHRVLLSLDVVERLLQDVMRGFGAVPRRGAEVGGILLGSITKEGGMSLVRINDFELVPIEYRRGPSYLLSEEDATSFTSTLERLRKGSTDIPIGLFRSHTRDGEGLGEEDRELMDLHFPAPDAPFLWIHPYATKVGTAGFYFRQDGAFAEGPPPLEFPFRRKDLAPNEKMPARGALPPRPAAVTRPVTPIAERPAPAFESPAAIAPEPVDHGVTRPLPAPEVSPAVASRTRWYWVPLSFIFLLLGVLLGIQAALSMHPQASSASDLYAVGLNVAPAGSDLHVKWDRQAAAIRAAQRGTLTIEDGQFSKTLDLDAGQLQNGSVVYRRLSNAVRFRLQLYTGQRDVLTETADWSQ